MIPKKINFFIPVVYKIKINGRKARFLPDLREQNSSKGYGLSKNLKKHYICGMRIFIVLILLLSVPVHAANFTIPQKFRGRYICEVPSYEIKHNGISTKVEALSAVLLVYKTKIILRIGDRSFPTNVEKKVDSKKNPVYQSEFSSPFQTCDIVFNKKDKTVYVDLPIFQLLPFKKVK